MAKEKEKAVEKREAGSSVQTERTRDLPIFLPATDIYENKDSLTLLMDVPGADKDMVNINLEQGVLNVTVNLECPSAEECEPRYTEFRVGNYERSFKIGEEIDQEKIEARINDGVLKLVLPKAESAKPKSIPVKS